MKNKISGGFGLLFYRLIVCGVLLWFAGTFPVQAAALQQLRGHAQAAWARLTPLRGLPGTNRLNLAIGLPLRHQAELDALLKQISDPVSPNYRHYLTTAQFTERFGPTTEDYQGVIAFAKASGWRVTATHPNRMVVDVEGSAADVEKALHVKMYEYQHPKEGRKFHAPDAEPALNLSVPILQISGLDDYSLPRPLSHVMPLGQAQGVLPETGSGPSGNYMGLDFRTAYAPDTARDGSGQAVGLLQFDGYTAGDIAYYESIAGLPSVTLSNVLVDGASGLPSGSGGEVEVSLDIEMVISMATNLSRVIVYMAPNPSPWVDILNRMANDTNSLGQPVARQLSCSWAGGGSNAVADQIFQQMAAQGQSFFVASGDDDAWTGAIPFPCDNPYITVVGGTTLSNSGPAGSWVSETVWNYRTPNPHGGDWGSSGGISTQYPMPWWQTRVSMNVNHGSTTMRNLPDVALTADNIYVRADGRDFTGTGGTSCAAPLWAGFCALINQQAAAQSKPPVGFINPAVYAIGSGANYAATFHDTTNGDNTWPGSPTNFYAVGGYDLCTGWGTPTGQPLIDALANFDVLMISPLYGFTSVGVVGGPFTVTSENLSLTNAGTNTLSWTAANPASWLDVSSSGGTLTPGGSAATVTVSLNSVANTLAGGTYNATLWFTNLNDNVAQSRQFTLIVVTPPTITTQPADQAVPQGAPATFTVGATGGLLSFQWEFNGANLVEGGNISGSTSSNLTIHAVSPANVGNYSVIVSNFEGVAVSSNASLSIVTSPPVILQQPMNQSATLAGTATFSVTVAGTTPFSYQWQFNGVNIAGATSVTLTLANVQFSQAGNYSVVINNAYGSVTSSNAVLTVGLPPSVPDAFNPVGGPYVLSTPVQTDGKILVGGWITSLDSVSSWNIGRVYADGTLDTNFNATTDSTINSMVLQTDGKILVGGSFTMMDGQSQPRLGRFNADGTLDTTFNSFGADNAVYALVVQADGKILVGGNFTSLEGPVSVPYIGRLTANGSLDGAFLTASANSAVWSIAVQPDGKVLVGGDFTLLDNQSRLHLGRLNSNGTLDAGFNASANNLVSALAVQPDGKILVGGNFTTLNGQSQPYLGRLNSDGTRDTSFNPTIVLGPYPAFNGYIYSLALQTDGKILVGGNLFTVNGQIQPNIARLNPDGTLDTTFTPSANSYVISLALQVDGKILVGGNFDLLGGQLRPGIGRLTPTVPATQSLTFDGSTINWQRGGSSPEVWRTTFDGSTNGTTWISLGAGTRVAGGWQFGGLNWPTNANLRARGFVVGGWDESTGWYVETDFEPPIIINQPSSLTVLVGSNVTFSVSAGSMAPPLTYQWQFNGANLSGATNSSLVLTNVQLTQAGTYAVVVSNLYGSVTSSSAVLTVLPPSVPDSFNPGLMGTVLCTAVQPDGKVLAAGALSLQNCQYICRVNADGTRDSNFNAYADNTINSVALQTDGKILVGGSFTMLNGQSQPRIGRLNADGSWDTTFNSFGADNSVYALAVQADGKIVVGGNFTVLAGPVSVPYIGRLTANGGLDASFLTAKANNTVYSVAVQPDGRILVGGNFTTLDNQSRTRLGRLNSNGTLDTNFNASANNIVSTLAVQADGKILVGGSFTTLAGQSRSYLGRLNADGTLDTSFTPALNGSVNSVVLQTDGKILVGGYFTTLNGQSRSYLGRLNTNGTLDTLFTPGANSIVLSLGLQVDGKILVGGAFSTLGGQSRAGIGRLTPTIPATQSLTFNGSNINWQRGGSSPEVWRTTFDGSTNGTTWISLGAGTRLTGGWQLSGPAWLTNANLRARGFVTGGMDDGSGWYVETIVSTTNGYSGQFSSFKLNDTATSVFAPPTLGLKYSGDTLLISWPATAGNMVLESSDTLLPGSWLAVPDLPQQVGDQNLVQVQMSGMRRFYRLRHTGP